MAKRALLLKSQKPAKFKSRAYNRCPLCGRPRAYYRKFDMCRICLRQRALRGEVPGVVKSSW
ncbi:MAG: type Z 30S ribosomal protein S14 [Myxococcales bacterium]|nr:type Z 30S ribosomal protein S14 [Myxococcales bacterium]